MFCPKCGVALPESSTNCSQCGFVIEAEDVLDSGKKQIVHRGYEQTIPASKTDLDPDLDGTWHKVKRVLFPIVGAVVLVMCFMAANSISKIGTEIMQISSVGGKTLEEAYYRELGGIYAGYANIARAIGISLASFLVWLGFKK